MSDNKSRNSQQTTTSNVTNDQTLAATDNRVGGDNAAIGGNVSTASGDISGGLMISTTDQGAIKGGVDIAQESLNVVRGAISGAQSSASDTIGQVIGLANEARQSETSGAINNLVKYGAWVVGAALVVYLVTRMPSKA